MESEHLVVKVEGLEELLKRLDKSRMETVAKRVVSRLAEMIKAEAIPYPPEGPWNRPGGPGSRWYQRHFGPRWMVKSGAIHGRDTSEQMQKRWLVNVKDSWRAYIGNTAKYSDYVMGTQQAAFHAQHGWRKLEDIARQVVDANMRNVAREEIDREIGAVE